MSNEHPTSTHTICPTHYTDAGRVCVWSGADTDWREGSTCPNGCSGARSHYTNDGHPQCAGPEES